MSTVGRQEQFTHRRGGNLTPSAGSRSVGSPSTTGSKRSQFPPKDKIKQTLSSASVAFGTWLNQVAAEKDGDPSPRQPHPTIDMMIRQTEARGAGPRMTARVTALKALKNDMAPGSNKALSGGEIVSVFGHDTSLQQPDGTMKKIGTDQGISQFHAVVVKVKDPAGGPDQFHVVTLNSNITDHLKDMEPGTGHKGGPTNNFSMVVKGAVLPSTEFNFNIDSHYDNIPPESTTGVTIESYGGRVDLNTLTTTHTDFLSDPERFSYKSADTLSEFSGSFRTASVRMMSTELGNDQDVEGSLNRLNVNGYGVLSDSLKNMFIGLGQSPQDTAGIQASLDHLQALVDNPVISSITPENSGKLSGLLTKLKDNPNRLPEKVAEFFNRAVGVLLGDTTQGDPVYTLARSGPSSTRSSMKSTASTGSYLSLAPSEDGSSEGPTPEPPPRDLTRVRTLRLGPQPDLPPREALDLDHLLDESHPKFENAQAEIGRLSVSPEKSSGQTLLDILKGLGSPTPDHKQQLTSALGTLAPASLLPEAIYLKPTPLYVVPATSLPTNPLPPTTEKFLHELFPDQSQKQFKELAGQVLERAGKDGLPLVRAMAILGTPDNFAAVRETLIPPEGVYDDPSFDLSKLGKDPGSLPNPLGDIGLTEMNQGLKALKPVASTDIYAEVSRPTEPTMPMPEKVANSPLHQAVFASFGDRVPKGVNESLARAADRAIPAEHEKVVTDIVTDLLVMFNTSKEGLSEGALHQLQKEFAGALYHLTEFVIHPGIENLADSLNSLQAQIRDPRQRIDVSHGPIYALAEDPSDTQPKAPRTLSSMVSELNATIERFIAQAPAQAQAFAPPLPDRQPLPLGSGDVGKGPSPEDVPNLKAIREGLNPVRTRTTSKTVPVNRDPLARAAQLMAQEMAYRRERPPTAPVVIVET